MSKNRTIIKFNKLFACVTLLLLITFLISPAAVAQELKIMTYNIYHGEQHYSPGYSNIKKVAEVINKYKPDFVACQEVDSMTNRTARFNNGVKKDLMQELAALTGMYGYFGKAMNYSDGGYGEGILSRSPTQSTNYALTIPHGGEGRALVMVKHTLSDGQKIIFAGTHLCHEHSENRLAQAKDICNFFSDNTIPVIMGGDFNIRPNSEPYLQILNSFNDAAVMFGNPKPTSSFENPRSRIDYIFVSKNHNWVINNVEVIKVNASDHMPVLVTLELKK